MELGKSFIQEFVIGFGFLSGLWINVGINPEAELWKALIEVINSTNPNHGLGFFFWFIPILILVVSLLGAFLMGHIPGLIAVGFGFLGGIFITSTIGIVFLMIGIILGLISPMLSG